MTNEPEDKTPREPRPRRDADAGRKPQLFAGRLGSRLFSLAALVEKVETQFYLEYDNDSPVLQEADTSSKRLRLIIDVVNYVIAVESIDLDSDAKADLIRRVYSNIFGYGALDALFLDERVTTISLEGAEKAAVRYGASVLQSLGAIFDDKDQFKRALERLLADAGAVLSDDTPILEVGMKIDERPMRISVVAPPYAVELSADIRVHPAHALTLDDLIKSDMLTPDAADMLRAIAASKYGFCIVGETESGKTTLLNAMLPVLPDVSTTIVERAEEMRPPATMKRFAAQWQHGAMPEISFGAQIAAALESMPLCLVLDEIRSDEPRSIAPLLELEESPRQIWAIRGVPDSKRLQSALGMLARRARVGAGEAAVHALYERLPFVITVARVAERTSDGIFQLFSIAEWQSRVDTDYPDYVMLMTFVDGAARRTDATLARWLD